MEIFRKQKQVSLRLETINTKSAPRKILTKENIFRCIRNFFSYLIFLVLILWIAISFRHNSVFPIKKIKVYGTFEHLESHAIKNIINQYIDTGFFGLNAMALTAKLMQETWLHNVSVQRVWPDQLLVFLEEEQPVLIWNNMVLYNGEGKAFMPDSKTFPQNLPKFTAQGLDAKTVFFSYQNINKTLEKLGRAVKEVFVDQNNSWHLTLDNGLMIVLGKKDIWKRLKIFVEAYPKIITKDGPRVPLKIDLRYRSGFAVSCEKKN